MCVHQCVAKGARTYFEEGPACWMIVQRYSIVQWMLFGWLWLPELQQWLPCSMSCAL